MLRGVTPGERERERVSCSDNTSCSTDNFFDPKRINEIDECPKCFHVVQLVSFIKRKLKEYFKMLGTCNASRYLPWKLIASRSEEETEES